MLPTAEPKRLFATEFTCQNDIILAYSFKRYNHSDEFQLVLNLNDEANGSYCQLICAGNRNSYGELMPGQKWCSALSTVGVDMRKILIHLSTKQERMLPSITPINGWEVR